MIYEFAVSPEICDSWQNLRFLMLSFGKEQGRLLSDIPRKSWFNQALKTVKQSKSPPLERKRMSECIVKLKKKSMHRRNFVPPAPNADWIDQALIAHKDRPFRAILTNRSQSENPCVLSNDFELTEKSLWQIPAGCIVTRTAGEMIEPIKPMLDCAATVILIDRNFDPGKKRFVRFLLEMIKYLSCRTFSPRIRTVSYHLGDKISPEHIEYLCNSKILPHLPFETKLNIYIWPKDELHDRYVLTDKGGVKYGIGLDENDGSSSKEVSINRIFDTEYKFWWGKCQNASMFFSICHNSNSENS